MIESYLMHFFEITDHMSALALKKLATKNSTFKRQWII